MLTRPTTDPYSGWSYGESADAVADVFASPDRDTGLPVLVLVHGGYWRPEYDRAHLRPTAAALARRGHLVVSLEYRRIPGDPDATTSDIRTALAALPGLLARHGVAADRDVLLVGHSAGGHLALWAATHAASRIRACVALAPVADLLEAQRLDLDDGAVTAFLGCPADARPDLDPTRCHAPAVPVTVIHGARDTLVPVALALSYAHARARDADTRLVVVPDAAHFELIDPRSPSWAIVLDELDRWRAPA